MIIYLNLVSSCLLKSFTLVKWQRIDKFYVNHIKNDKNLIFVTVKNTLAVFLKTIIKHGSPQGAS